MTGVQTCALPILACPRGKHCPRDAHHRAGRRRVTASARRLNRRKGVVRGTLTLNARHVLIDTVPMFRGTLSQTAVYPREVVKTALAFNASAVVLAHNHPSGDADPSRADDYLTQTLKSALRLVDVNVLDHFVVAGNQVLSFAERGML